MAVSRFLSPPPAQRLLHTFRFLCLQHVFAPATSRPGALASFPLVLSRAVLPVSADTSAGVSDWATFPAPCSLCRTLGTIPPVVLCRPVCSLRMCPM